MISAWFQLNNVQIPLFFQVVPHLVVKGHLHFPIFVHSSLMLDLIISLLTKKDLTVWR
jgi:hypothetical protein